MFAHEFKTAFAIGLYRHFITSLTEPALGEVFAFLNVSPCPSKLPAVTEGGVHTQGDYDCSHPEYRTRTIPSPRAGDEDRQVNVGAP